MCLAWIKKQVILISCVSLVSTRKEARWSVRFFSLLTVNNEGYVQQTSKQNCTLNSNDKSLAQPLYISPNQRWFRKGKQLECPWTVRTEESSITFEIYSNYVCLKVSRETLTTIDSFLEQSRSIQSIYSTDTISTTNTKLMSDTKLAIYRSAVLATSLANPTPNGLGYGSGGLQTDPNPHTVNLLSFWWQAYVRILFLSCLTHFRR